MYFIISLHCLRKPVYVLEGLKADCLTRVIEGLSGAGLVTHVRQPISEFSAFVIMYVPITALSKASLENNLV